MPFNLQPQSMPPLSSHSLFGPMAHGAPLRSQPGGETQSNPIDEPAPDEADPFVASLVSLAEIGEHTAMLVHEMRSPLSVILNGLRLCEQMPLPKTARQRLTLALEEAEQVNRLVNDVLAFARHARFPTFHWGDLELNALMAEVLQLMDQMLLVQHRQIHLETSETPIWVRGDRDKLKQVLLNLLVNACEALEETDSIRCRVELAADQAHSLLRICNGSLPLVNPTRSPFPRRDKPRRRLNLGLGLLLVKRLIEAHGGTFWLEETARDTVAVVQLPVRFVHV